MIHAKIKFLLLFIILINLKTLHASSIRIDDFSDVEVYGGNSTYPTETIYFEAPSSSEEGNSADNPLTLYLPFDSGSGQDDYIYFSDKQKIPQSGGQAFVGFYIDVRNDSTDVLYINAAIRNSSDEYEAFNIDISDSSREIDPSTEVEVKLNLSLADICDQVDSYRYCESDTDFEETLQLYIYLSDSIENDSDVEETEDGLFVDLNLSDEIPDGNFIVNSVDRGDDQLVFNISDGDSITQMGDSFLNVLIFKYSGTTVQQVVDFASSTSLFFQELNETTDDNDEADDESDSESEEFNSGSITVNELVNGETYNLAFAKINKYLFLSKISGSLVGTPQNIETFLNEQSCFLLSAGFQTNHYVLDYFRSFRDRVLLTNKLGKSFVKYYYDTAPKYASFIYQNELLSFSIRIVGHFLYIIFNYWFLFIGLLVVVLGAFKVNRLSSTN
jgi:hypothetical protein